MRGPSGGGCGRAVIWPAASLGVGQAETLRYVCVWLMKPSLSSGGDSGACVSQMLPSTSVPKRQIQDEGSSRWACWDHRAASWET